MTELQKLIAIDYDGTYTECPRIWNVFIQAAKQWGYEVWIVTSRYEPGLQGSDLPPLFNGEPVTSVPQNVPVVYCNGRAKEEFVWHECGRRVDIWCDNDPKHIVEPW